MKKWVYAVIILVGSVALSHGGDKPGPHGGFIEMPGAFHTEVVPEEGNSFKVYLIDINFENPTVEAWLENGKKKDVLACTAKEDHFQCAPKSPVGKATKLVVKAKREQAEGNEATYKLPLHRSR